MVSLKCARSQFTAFTLSLTALTVSAVTTAATTNSLAVMSMVGYILGLGDRHPSNLMLDRFTGKILHIDFGDCFEVAMQRDKFPERVPFRLTRMLVNAMEVCASLHHYIYISW
jgi:Phosphatidylinositol 3- and 4-kinase